MRRCVAFQAEAKVLAARWLPRERVGRNGMELYWVWRKLEEFEVLGQIGAEGVCGGLLGTWVVSWGDVGWSEKVLVG